MIPALAAALFVCTAHNLCAGELKMKRWDALIAETARHSLIHNFHLENAYLARGGAYDAVKKVGRKK